MRSETVVLPASMWAAMPMLRILDRSRDINSFPFVAPLAAWRRRVTSANTKPAEASDLRGNRHFGGDCRVPMCLSGSAPAGLAFPSRGSSDSRSRTVREGELRMSLGPKLAGIGSGVESFPFCVIPLILTTQGFGQHEPLIWLDLHQCSLSE